LLISKFHINGLLSHKFERINLSNVLLVKRKVSIIIQHVILE